MMTPVNSFANAITAYNRALNGGGEAMEPRDSASGDTFAGLVKSAVHGAIQVLAKQNGANNKRTKARINADR